MRPPPTSPHLGAPELSKCFQTWIWFCSSYINCSHTPLIPGHVKCASGFCFFFSPLLWLFLSCAEALPILVLKADQCRLTRKSWLVEEAQSAGEMIARKLKPFISYSRVRTVAQKSSSLAIEKSTYFMIAFPNRKSTAGGRGAVLAKHRQPKGYLWSWGRICEVPSLAVAGFSHACPQSAASKFGQRGSFQQLASHFFPDRVIPGGFRWEE